MSAPSLVPGAATGDRRRFWVAGTFVLTAVGFGAAILLAPSAGASPEFALTALLFVGSSAHVASSAWFASLPQVRGYGRQRPGRYLIAPAALVVVTAVGASAVPPGRFAWLLLGYFGWQFFHFQRQNLGLAAVAASSTECAPLTRAER